MDQLSTTATRPAGPGEKFIILQLRIERLFIEAYNNPASMEFQILAINITTEVL